MFSFLSNHKPAFGLDVSGSSFKVMEIHKSGHEAKVRAYGETAIPKGMIANDTIVDPKAFSELLKKGLTKLQLGQLSSNYAVASLPESKSFVRIIQIPKMSEREAEAAIPVE